MRRLIALLGIVAVIVGLAACDPDDIGPAVPVAGTPDPVVLVHGWNSDPGAWDVFVKRLKADGFPADRIVNFDYDDSQSNITTAAELATAIDQALARTGATRVDVVTHSMGALPIRFLMKHVTATWSKVDAIAAIAGTNHGTNLAYLWFSDSVQEMKPGSDFLDDLNAGDETPGPARWTTFWSACDDVINPDESALLAGATNTQTGCLEHSALHDDRNVYIGVRHAID